MPGFTNYRLYVPVYTRSEPAGRTIIPLKQEPAPVASVRSQWFRFLLQDATKMGYAFGPAAGRSGWWLGDKPRFAMWITTAAAGGVVDPLGLEPLEMRVEPLLGPNSSASPRSSHFRRRPADRPCIAPG